MERIKTKGGAGMSIYGVKVGFMGDKQDKVLYHKYYEIYAESAEKAAIFVMNTLSVSEFHNFIIVDVKEIKSC